MLLSLDAGTSSTRALAFDSLGRKLGSEAQRRYDQKTTPDGGVEVGADHLLQLTAACIDELLPQLQGEIVGVAMSCFWHSLMCVDEHDLPLTGVLSWADNRAAAWVGPLKTLLDEDSAHARTGCVFHPSYWPAKLLWLHQARPELFQKPQRWMSFAEYLCLKWTGEARVSLSMASGTGLFHQNNCAWDDAMLHVLPIGREQLSPLCDAHDALPALKPEYQARWPQLRGAKWFPALGDGACSNIGSGCADSSSLALNAGTSGALRVVLEGFEAPAPHGLWRYRIDKRRSVMGGAISNVGNVLLWARHTLQLPDDWASQMSALSPDAHGLTVLPFLAGERSPLWNANARLTIEGANLDTTPVEMLRACLEGAALRFEAVADALRQSANLQGLPIVSTGGALDAAPGWSQIICDALGAPLIEGGEKEASARGAALMAAEACGLLDNIRDAPFERGATLQPDMAHHRIYTRALERQNALYEELYGHGELRT